MNATSKLILAVGFALNAAAIATVSAVTLHRIAIRQSPVIDLGTIVVTPGDMQSSHAATGTVNLGTIVVTPTHAESLYATTVQLGTIIVTPGEAENRVTRVATARTIRSGKTAIAVTDTSAAAEVVEALDQFSPGQYLDASTALQLLDRLVFDRTGG